MGIALLLVAKLTCVMSLIYRRARSICLSAISEHILSIHLMYHVLIVSDRTTPCDSNIRNLYIVT